MEALQNQLALFKFGEKEFKILGTQDKPLIRCSDILIHLLEYRKSNDARWFRDMDQELKDMYVVQGGGLPSFNEQGIYWALMKSDKPVARQFQKVICELLVNLRKGMAQQLESQKKRIAELEQERTGQIYCHIVRKEGDPWDGKIVNVGQTLEYTRRFAQYERDIKALVDSYKGREMLVALAFFQINGYRIVGELLEKDVPQSELRPMESQYQEQLQTFNCPRKRFPMEQNREKVRCGMCNREVLGASMASHLKTKICLRHRTLPSELEAIAQAMEQTEDLSDEQ